MYKKVGKRGLDLMICIPLLIVVSPLLVFISLLVMLRLGRPVVFRQKRPGLHEKPFLMYKFRSMTNATDAEGQLLPDAKRTTGLGRFLRSTSLDELPELINVLRGDMSLVGPRPLLMEYLPYYRERERSRHSVRPGLTGLSQVSGRNDLPWDKRLEMDVEYVERCSFHEDLKILGKTIVMVLKRDGSLPVPGVRFERLDVERMAQRKKGVSE